MRLRVLPALCFLFLAPMVLRAQTPRLSDERVVLHTVGGDVVIALYPDAAPGHAQQILNLVRLGCYDHTHFGRVEPGFVMQLDDVAERPEEYALTAAQEKAIHPLKAEFSPTLHHRRGTVSMARQDGKPDSATTSFSILLGEAPHLDGQYTIFGEVVAGMDAVDKLVLVPPKFYDPSIRPVPMVALDVQKAEVVNARDLDPGKLAPAHDVRIPPEFLLQAHRDAWVFHRTQAETPGRGGLTAKAFGFETTSLLTGGVVLVILLSLVSFVSAGRLTLRWLVSLNMLTILVGAFLLLALLAPYAHAEPVLAVIVFVSFCGVFKLLSRFESVG